MNDRETLDLQTIDRRLQRLVAVRAALAPFAATLRAQVARVHEPGVRRTLVILWRPCQERIDTLLESSGAGPLHLLRQELEDGLLDEQSSPAALVDAADALDQACELLLTEIARELNAAVSQSEPFDRGGTP